MKRNITAEERISAVKRYTQGGESLQTIANSTGIGRATLRDWIANFESMGPEAFCHNGNTKYSLDFKTEAVEYYLFGNASQLDTCKKFKIKSRSQLRNWILLYNGHKLKASPGGNTTMTRTKAKGRKTTLEERISIVEDHIRSGMSYAETAEKYHVSYQQVYQWVQKYLESGEAGLSDRRGKRKSDDELDELERLRRENQRLKKKLEESERLNLLLKKVKEFEGR